MSDTARWDRVKSLFLRANEMDAESREQLLAALAAEDPSLAQEVRTLHGIVSGLAGLRGKRPEKK